MLDIRIKNGFSSLIPYLNFVAEGVIQNKTQNSLTSAFYYFGVDLDSKSQEERDALCSQVNAVLARIDGGWTVNIDSIRMAINRYPLSSYSRTPSVQLIEAERKEHFERKGIHYQSVYVMTLTFTPGILQHKKLRSVFVNDQTATASNELNMSVVLSDFEKTLEKIVSGLSGAGLTVERMDTENLFSFLHYCITGEFQNDFKITARYQENPEMIESLDFILGGYDYISGFEPKINYKRIFPITVFGYPQESYSGILEILNCLPFPYRSSMRFIMLDPLDAQSLITKIRTNWYNKQFSPINALMQLVSPGSENRFTNDEAVRKADDAQAAINESLSGVVRYGFYTHSIIIINENEQEGERQSKQVVQLLKNSGFLARIEYLNATESYLGSLPANTHRNIHKPLINTFNFAHFFPMNSQWLGSEVNPHPRFPKESPALFAASTITQTPYFGNIHSQDVGHGFIVGSSGYGKSVLQRFIITSFLRYPEAQVIAFDNQKAFYTLVKSCGGDYFEILNESNDLSFCPLQAINTDSEKLWAAGWLEELITLQGVEVTPKQRQAISEALDMLRNDKVKSLSNFYSNLMDRTLKSALDPFVSIQNGVMSKLLDASSDNLSVSNLQVFEVGTLLNLDHKFSIPAISYLFHKIDTRLDGRPTLLVLAESWKLFDNPTFASKLNEYLRICRAKNASVIFESHSMADLNNTLKNVIVANCLTKIFLPNPLAQKATDRELYKSFGLNDGQIELIASAIPKRHYYWVSPEGSALIDLELQQGFMALMGKNTKVDIEFIKSIKKQHGDMWPARYLEDQSLQSHAKLWEEFFLKNNKSEE